eukprot:NODE_4302_length_1908_cov_6.608647.p1 GENE.NODE_4302_length_1908_cov_6.608647~~NODE_4302_length_1908_cov_6.608647.p1  ORF type:complete len:300 (-),score=78.50 NODE_4302_length_1908_cov_6.608647:265-1164(-)
MRARSGTAMGSARCQATEKIPRLKGPDSSTSAWAFPNIGSERDAATSAAPEEVTEEADSLGAQQLGTLGDLQLPCQAAVETRLHQRIDAFLARLPATVEDFRRGGYLELVEDFEVDNFGAAGDRRILDAIGIRCGQSDFGERAARFAVEYQEQHAETWWRSECLLHARVVSYAEFDLTADGGGGALHGSRFQQNGYQGAARRGQEWILPTRLPLNCNVDRSLCSEAQLLAGICDDLMSPTGMLQSARGYLRLFVTGAPCLSCIGSMRQFQLLLPHVALSVDIGEELHCDAVDQQAHAAM